MELKLKKDGERKKKKNTEKQEIFETLNSLIKALKYDMELYSTLIYDASLLAKRGHERGKFEIMIWIPLLF